MTDMQPDAVRPRSIPTKAPRPEPTRQLVVAAAWSGVTVPALALALVGPVPAALLVAMAGYVAFTLLALRLMQRGYPYADLGLCNLVTLLRLALATALLAPLLAPASGWAVIGVALAALALDGVDGWLARRDRHVSAFGARLDVEVDAALSLILALNALASGTVGSVVLLLGLPRYAFMAAALLLPQLARPLPERFDRKLVCVVQIAVLIALQAPVVDGAVALALVMGTACALAWSFGRDVLWLLRTPV
jgi:phosphatidylglycerophosphate synthase